MPHKDSHPSGQQLLSYIDGELSSRNATRLRAHLEACCECRARLTEIEVASAGFMQAYHHADPMQSGIPAPRALLRARLAELVRNSGNKGWRRFSFALDARGLLCVCVLGILVLLGAQLVYRQTARHIDRSIASAGLLPNPNLTPGSTRPVTLAYICSLDHDEVVQVVPSPLKQEVFKEYGIRGVPTRNYEVDYLITPGLGGSDDVRNLWPEPHYSAVWNSYVKDQLEARLHHMVCGGQLSLDQAQKDISHNWIAAYKKYFHTDRPLPLSSSSVALNNLAMITDRRWTIHVLFGA